MATKSADLGKCLAFLFYLCFSGLNIPDSLNDFSCKVILRPYIDLFAIL